MTSTGHHSVQQRCPPDTVSHNIAWEKEADDSRTLILANREDCRMDLDLVEFMLTFLK